MPKVTYLQYAGTPHEIEVPAGNSVMEGATANLVPGIDADCGGACACATCHVVVTEAWADKVGQPSDIEDQMLDVVFERKPTSRLSCQIKVDEQLDGLVVQLPEMQG